MASAGQLADAAQDARLSGLPLIEVPAKVAPQPVAAARMAVMLSGDGGWAALDRDIAAGFARRGIPVIGIDSLRYFWKTRAPQQAADDVAAVIDHYLDIWHRSRVDLVGYSFGADVLPFIANRLPVETAAKLSTITMVEPSLSATFEIHLSDWLPGVTTDGVPLAPEMPRLKIPPLCLHGGSSDTICSSLPPAQVTQIGKGHHLGGDGEPIVERILR